MNNKSSLVALIVIAIIAIGGYKYPDVVPSFGAAPGPEFLEHLEFKQGFTKGGTAVATSSTAATYTLTAAELRKNVSYLSWTVNVNTTLTTMASTSAPFSGLRTGESFSVWFYNASSTAAATATFAAGTGVDLQESEGGTVILNGLEFAKITFIKKANSDIGMIFEGMQVGD